MLRTLSLTAFLAVVFFGAVSALGSGDAAAQMQPRPKIKGKTYRLKVDSSPQQAAVYWDAGATGTPKTYGIAGYTPVTIKVPKGTVKIVIELSGFKPVEQVLEVRKNQTLSPTLERAPRVARLDLQSGPTARAPRCSSTAPRRGRSRTRSSCRPVATRSR